MSKYKLSKKIGKDIPDNQATTWIDNYKKRHKDGIHAYFFGSDIIHKILKHPEAVGLRVYLGYSIDEETKKENLQMVLIGARQDGTSIWSDSSLDSPGDGGGVGDGGTPCPPYC